jgi:hypothetical protein
MAKRTKRACIFTAPYGSRSIWRNGKPFISIQRDGDTPPVHADDVSRKILRLLCGRR